MRTYLFLILFPSLLLFPDVIDAKVGSFDQPYEPGELLVVLKDSENLQYFSFLEKEASLIRFRNLPIIRVKFKRALFGKPLMMEAEKIARSPFVEIVEPNYLIQISSVWPPPPTRGVIPNDQYFDDLHGMIRIQMPLAWSVQKGSRDVVVVVPDSGIDYFHPEMADNIWINRRESGFDDANFDKRINNRDDDNNGYVDDWRGWDFVFNDNDPFDDHYHGTLVSGIIGARGNNSAGVAGVAWNVSILPLKFIDGLGEGQVSKAMQAIEYAVVLKREFSENITVINASWGMSSYSEALKLAIDEANKADILFVAAAGNDNEDNDKSPIFPASYNSPNIISVAASDRDDLLAYFSNYGGKSVHLAAPGEAILSTLPRNEYNVFDGTSFAAPHVAGAIALVKAQYPHATAADLKNRILNNVDDVDEFKEITISGGRLNVYRALQY